MGVVVEAGLEAVRAADSVIVPAWPRVGEPVPDEVAAALRDAHGAGARLMAICSGAFVLAATGLLDGRRAATHWRYAAALRAAHPAIEVDESVLYVDDGALLTSAGSAAGLDLCLHVVRRDHGASVANAVARRLVLAPHREGGQAQFIERPVAAPQDDRLRQAMDWALRHLDRRITVADLAARAFMSPRTFGRRFTEAVGQTPQSWLTAQRVQAALPLLERTDLPVEQIALHAGFGDAAALRKHFRRSLGVTPTQYRRGFATGAAASGA
jgi:AraC family transcriptional activator FtrA